MAASLSFPEGRFYEAEFPEVDDIVVVQVKRIVDMGAYVSLLEYDGQEGMMLLSELSKRRIRSVAKLLKVGRVEICMVLRADVDKGYVDLSKRRVDAEDGVLKEESFAKAKAVHSIMRHVASANECDLEDFCGKFAWPLYRKYGNAYDPWKRHINGDINLWNELKFSGPEEEDHDLTEKAEKIKEDIEQDLRRKLITQMLRMRAKVDVSCSEYEGINAIKEALMKGLEESTEECDIKIKLIAHPTFVLTCMCKDKVLGLKKLQEAVDKIQACIEEKKGLFVLKQPPQVDNNNQDDKASESGSDGAGSDSGTSDDASDMGDLDAEQLKKLEEMKVDSDADDK